MPQVAPIRIHRPDQIDFPLTRPVLDVLLALDRDGDRIVLLEIDKARDVVLFRKAWHQFFTVFVDTANEIIGHAHIERSTRLACQNVNPITHAKMMDCRVKPGNYIFFLVAGREPPGAGEPHTGVSAPLPNYPPRAHPLAAAPTAAPPGTARPAS